MNWFVTLEILCDTFFPSRKVSVLVGLLLWSPTWGFPDLNNTVLEKVGFDPSHTDLSIRLVKITTTKIWLCMLGLNRSVQGSKDL